MADWRHECGYKEPEECGFCEHFLKVRNEQAMRIIGREGTCGRIPDKAQGDRTQYLREHACSSRGTCRHFRRRS